jgi:GntR family transcriptional repressor for pyruvate dehydrogenase complex
MEVMGLLERRPGGGSVVTDVNIWGLLNILAPIFFKREGLAIELVELRYLLETRAAELAARNITVDRAEELRECLERMASAQAAEDPEAEALGDIDFHETIFSFSDNLALRQAATFITDLLENSVRFGRRVVLEGGYGDEELLAQHRHIYDAIVDGNPVAARKAMESHMNLVVEYYLKAAE